MRALISTRDLIKRFGSRLFAAFCFFVAPAILFAGDAPVITQTPNSVTVPFLTNTTVTLSIAASGTDPLTYFWAIPGRPLQISTTGSLTLSNLTPASAGNYAVTVSNAFGTTISANARIDVEALPFITLQPAGTNVTIGQSPSLSVSAYSATPLGYQWFAEGVALAGATNATTTLTNFSFLNIGSYQVVVTNAHGATTSAAVNVGLLAIPIVTNQPQATAVYLGQGATFTVGAYSTTPVGYQWNFGGVTLTNQTNSTLVLANLTSTNAGYYYAVLTNGYGSATTVGAQLIVNPLPAPSLRFGTPTFSTGSANFPLLYTVNTIETNVSFSVGFDPAIYSGALFTPAADYTVSTNNPPEAGGEFVQASTNSVGIKVTFNTQTPLIPGETQLGVLSFILNGEGSDPYSGKVAFTNTPFPLSFYPGLTNLTSTNVLTTNTTVSVVAAPPVFTDFSKPTSLNPQTGFLETELELANPGAGLLDNVLLVIGSLGYDSQTNLIQIENAHGYFTTGQSFVNLGALAPTERRRLTLEYYVSDRFTVPNPTLEPYGTPAMAFIAPTGTVSALPTPLFISAHSITNGTLTNAFISPGFLLQFPTKSGFRYYVQYVDSPDMNAFTNINSVQTALPPVTGTGSNVQWLDSGPPKTVSPPSIGGRFYRVLETQ
jgi:hypothetical protein